MKRVLRLLSAPFVWAHLNPKIQKFFKVLDIIIAQINKNIAVFGLIAGVAIVAINVCLRFASGFYPSVHSLAWGEEVSSYCFIWSALFGSAYGFRKGVHISVMVLVEKFPPKWAKASVLLSHILGALFLAITTPSRPHVPTRTA